MGVMKKMIVEECEASLAGATLGRMNKGRKKPGYTNEQREAAALRLAGVRYLRWSGVPGRNERGKFQGEVGL